MNKIIFVQAFKSLKRHWSRTLLSSLGIMIGIASVTVVLASSDAFEKLVIDQVSIFGDDWVEVEIKHPVDAEALGTIITSLTVEDAEAVFDLPNIQSGYYMLLSNSVMHYQAEFKNVMGWAVSEQFVLVDKGELAEGRFFTKEENDSSAKVVVLGKKIREKFFGDSDPLGKIVKINNLNFKVIGVYEERGTLMGFYDMDEMIYLPAKTEQNFIQGINHIQAIIAQVKDKTIIGRTADDIRYLLQERHEVYTPEEEDFRVITMEESIEILGTVIDGVKLLLLAIAGISILVGGVGIMNVMYVSVSERTFEIGLRKSVGAKKANILRQFIIEAILVTFLGGIFGILFSFLIAYILNLVIANFGIDMKVIVTIHTILIASSFSVVIGIVFGIYPARKAARLKPIEALRKK